ncbi:MAG: ribulose-bisphosphate carboxylase large subunit family protein [Pirellulales bacterium]|nr:ribulose-bisphosphate carboxylase large subunit family protein [Pirellulales bacterium]
MAREFVRATYWIETPHPLEQAVAALAGEQSCGTFVRVPGETDELRRRHLAHVERISPLDVAEKPTLPGGAQPPFSGGTPQYQRAELVLAFPLENMGVNLPTLLATVTGNLFELREFTGLRLLDLELPAAFAALPGPQFGVAGTRRLAEVFARPLIGTIVKPSVGLSPAETAATVRTLVEAGVDFIKDDELLANPPHSPVAERVAAVMRVINELADRNGRKAMYAFNVSDELDAMYRHHDAVVAHGGTCVMISMHHVGPAGALALRRRSQVPIHGHRNGWGLFSRSPGVGVEYAAWQKIWRLAGVDHLHVNGLQNKFCESDDSVERSIKACLTPMFGDDRAMPVVSSGQWGGQAPETFARTGTVDLMYLAGGGVMAHPGGPAAGCRAIRQAWEAAVSGATLADYARNHPELQQSLKAFGKAGAPAQGRLGETERTT